MKTKLFALIISTVMVIVLFIDPISAFADSSGSSSLNSAGTSSQYSYELYALSEIGSTLYNNVNSIIYIKTDNPDLCDFRYNIGLISTEYKPYNTIFPNRYDDITYRGEFDGYHGIYKVDNGYLINFRPIESGEYEFIIPELDKDSGKLITGCRFAIQVHDYDTEENEWIDKIISSQTTDDMTNFEKMDAVAQYLRGKFIYPTYYSDRTHASLASVPNSPFFKTNRADSAVSPDVLCDIAKRIGGFDKIDSLYDNYEEYGYDWSGGHFLCYCEANGISKYYQACPAMSSGFVSKTTIDLNDAANLYKLKGISFLPRYEGVQKDIMDLSSAISSRSFIYDGKAKEPAITVKDGSSILTEGVDYKVCYLNNTNVGTATVIITGIGKYVGISSMDFLIKDHEDPIITNSCIYPSGSFSMEYTGCELRPFSVKYGDTTLTEGVDYTVDYSDNTAVGTAYCTISGTGKYKGSITKTFNIIRSDISKSSINISMEDGPFYYTGEEIKPKITITDTVYDPAAKNYKTISLIEGKDYTLKYAKNIYYWDQSSAIITGIGNYSGTATKSFNITYIGSTPDLSDDSSFLVTLSKTSYIYDGTAKTPTATVKYYSTTLKENTDYTVSYSNNVNAGTATAKITGKGSYTGTLSKTYIINKASIGTGTMTLSQYSYEYDGAAKKPSATIKLGSKALVSGTDYTVSYSNNTNAGAATVTATGTGNYSGTLNATFYITEPEVITPDPIPTVIDISDCTATLSDSSYIYDGTAKTPDVTVKNDSADLVNGTDYTVSYSNNINAGTATVTITGKGTYTGTISKTFTISTANINDTEIGISATHYTYSGNACRPSIAVKSGSSILTNGADYTVVYKNNVNVGTATVTITGKGNYSGSLEKTFTISPASVSSATATLSTTFFSYTGYAKRPTVTVKIGTKTLTNGTDYTVTYSNNVKAGTATAKITGKGNYTGTISKNYTINTASISSATVALSSTYYSYNGSAKTPAVTVKIGTKTLIKGTDYTVTYSNNKNIGTAIVKITGKGNYKNAISKSFNIYPANVTGTKASSIAKNSITISCNKVTGATGYVFYKYNNSTKKWVRISKRTSNSYTFTGLSTGTNYRFTVRAYKTVNGKEVLSKNYTSFYTSTIPATVSFTVKSNAKKKATLTWKKVTGATSYIVYYKTSKSGKWKKITTLANSKTSYTKSGLTSGKTYYFTVKAVKNYNGKNYNAKITTKSVKVK